MRNPHSSPLKHVRLCVLTVLFAFGPAAANAQDDSTILAQAEPRGTLADILEEQQRIIDQNLLADTPLPSPIEEADRQGAGPFGDREVPSPRSRPRYDESRSGSFGDRSAEDLPDDNEAAPPRLQRQAERSRPSFTSGPGRQRPSAAARPARSATPALSSQRRTSLEGGEEQRPAETDTSGRSDSESLATGSIRQGPVLSPDADDFKRTARIGSIDGNEANTEYQEADEIFQAVGFRAGGMVLRPSIESGMTVTDNVNLTPEGEGAVLSETTLRIEAATEGSDDTASLNGFLTYEKSISGADFSEPEGGVNASAQYGLTSDLRLNATAFYAGKYEGAEAPFGTVAPDTSSFEHSFGSSVGIEKYEGPARYAMTGEVERTAYSDADSASGTVSQDDRNTTLLNLRLRAGYEISPALVPFVEMEIGRRFYDNEVDASGFERSSDRYALRGGVEIDLSEKLRGEIAAGYITERTDDDDLADVDGFSIEGSLAWSPMRGTDVALGLRTEVEGATGTGASGSLLRGVDLTITRQLRADLEVAADFTAERRDYVETDDEDTILSAQLGATYWLNRSAAIIGRILHERQTSTLPDRDYKANSAFLGIRLQR
ncbi:outer membrane beta-barrel protein [Notoacmeibacter ruber]|uniref:Outer membrane beta-barrel protein n=1 Tax=Notoacmeibacter ruber TaxID=2670375 RepID=A0A3L7JDR5_9HYPH|nr:outer membrane beta-barrel protein [Notoacmeibacter ruber]RLQ88459.1 hypothetical protein D8780_09820 [Notoacmeibacter ruber]